MVGTRTSRDTWAVDLGANDSYETEVTFLCSAGEVGITDAMGNSLFCFLLCLSQSWLNGPTK
jgi:hypothetical protein